MNSTASKIRIRQSEIEESIASLQRESQLLRMAEDLTFFQAIVRSTDIFGARTSLKFAVLATASKHLRKNKKNREGGDTADAIYREVRKKIPELQISTFRSHLSRFKKEGRFLYDEKTSTWRLPQSCFEGNEDE